jgi:hypothetical protein
MKTLYPSFRQVGKHVGDLQSALPLRAVCKDWAETVALGADAAELDLAPDSAYEAQLTGLDGDDDARRARFFRRCPFVRTLTYHVSPGTTFTKVGASWGIFHAHGSMAKSGGVLRTAARRQAASHARRPD